MKQRLRSRPGEHECEGRHEGRGSDQGIALAAFVGSHTACGTTEENPYSSHAAIQPKDTSACWSYRVLLKAHDRSVLIRIIRHAAEGEHPRRQSGSMGVAGRTVDLSQFARRQTRSICRRAVQPPNLGSSFDEAPVSPCRSFFLDSLQDRRDPRRPSGSSAQPCLHLQANGSPPGQLQYAPGARSGDEES